jgi:hypothetical protein
MRIKMRIDFEFYCCNGSGSCVRNFKKNDTIKNVQITQEHYATYNLDFGDGWVARDCSPSLFEIFSSDSES